MAEDGKPLRLPARQSEVNTSSVKVGSFNNQSFRDEIPMTTFGPRRGNLHSNAVRKGGQVWDSTTFFLMFWTDRRLKMLNILQTVFSFGGIMLMIVELEIVYANNGRQNTSTTVLKSLISALTVALLVVICMYYQTLLKQLRLINDLDSVSLYQAGLLKFLGVELCLCAFHIPPGVDHIFFSKFDGKEVIISFDTLALAMFVRLYIILRLVRDHSILLASVSRYVSEAKFAKFDLFLAFKTVMQQAPFHLLGFLGSIYVLSATFVIHVCERHYQEVYASKQNSLWNIIVTMSTLGYGDMAPVTTCGRGIAAVTASSGLLLSALLVTIMTQKLALDPVESHIVTLLRKASKKPQVEERAAAVIQTAWRYYACLRREQKVREVDYADILTENGKIAKQPRPSQELRRRKLKLFSALRKQRIHKADCEDIMADYHEIHNQQEMEEREDELRFLTNMAEDGNDFRLAAVERKVDYIAAGLDRLSTQMAELSQALGRGSTVQYAMRPRSARYVHLEDVRLSPTSNVADFQNANEDRLSSVYGDEELSYL